MPNKQPPPLVGMSMMLPKEVRDALAAASALPDFMDRRRAIEDVIERAKRNFPQYFTQE